MPSVSERTLNFRGFIGGLNVVDPPTELKDDELVECHNFLIGNNGQLMKRGGFFKHSSTILAAGLSSFYILGIAYAQQKYIAIGGSTPNNIYSVFVNGAGTVLTGAPANESPWWMLHINGTTYFGFLNTPGVRPLAGTVIGANIANSPGGRTAVWHKSRIFADVYSSPGRVAFSDPNTPGTWQTTSTIDVGVEDREQIQAFASIGDLLLIFKNTSIWSLYVQGDTPGNWVLKRISNGLGAQLNTSGKTSVVVRNNEAFFISQSFGIFKTNGYSFIELSRKVWKFPDGIYAFGGLDYNIAFYRNNLVILLNNPAVVSGTTSRVMFFYNTVNGAWSTWDFLSTTFDALAVIPPFVPSNNYIMLGIIGNTVYGFDYSNDAYYYDYLQTVNINNFMDGFADIAHPGSAFTSSFQTKEITTGLDEFLRSEWVGLEYTSRTPGPTFKMVRDDVVGSAQTPGFNILRKGYKISGAARCRSMALRCEHALTSPFEFDRASIHLTPKIPIIGSGTP